MRSFIVLDLDLLERVDISRLLGGGTKMGSWDLDEDSAVSSTGCCVSEAAVDMMMRTYDML
jgi:hypothetical protein